MLNNKDLQFQQFCLAMQSRIHSLKCELESIDKEAKPEIYSHLLIQLQASSDLLFDMTGTRAPEFKSIIAKL